MPEALQVPFQLNDSMFTDVLDLFADPGTGMTAEQTLDLINSSELLLSLLHSFKDNGLTLTEGLDNAYSGAGIELDLNFPTSELNHKICT